MSRPTDLITDQEQYLACLKRYEAHTNGALAMRLRAIAKNNSGYTKAERRAIFTVAADRLERLT